MNRSLKFRIYSFLDKAFHHFTLEEGYPQGIAGGVSEPQQYTGLNDSKGNPIYEGDIVINTTSEEEYCSPAVIIWGKYEFVGFALAYKCNKLEDYHDPLIHKINGVDLVEEFSLSKMGIYQIVGNVSENPELLK
jgi:uncharacterized phage protein (TIGR01671 family)